MMRKLTRWGLTLFCFQSAMAYAACSDILSSSVPAPATSGLFGATICSDRFDTVTFESNNIESLIDQLDESELEQHFVGFDDEAVFYQADFRGLPVIIAFPVEGGARLEFRVPSLGIEEAWDGGTREASKDKFEDYLKTKGDEIMKALIRVSPVDPVAGNPASLQNGMVVGDYEAATNTDHNNSSNRVGLAARFGRYSQGEREIDVLTLPFSYTVKFGKSNELIFRLPLTYSKVEGAESYRVVLGLGYKRLVTNRWALTPSVSYGATGSVDLGTVGQIISGSLTSEYLLIDQPWYTLRIANMAGYYKTLPFSAGDYDVDLDTSNTILRNGLSLSIPIGKIAGREMSFETFLTDTQFLGDELYIDQYNEIGISIGPMKRGGKKDSFSGQDFGLGAKYSHYSKGHGFSLYARYRF